MNWDEPVYRVPQEWPGHTLDITRMRNPVAYRAECTCGEWMDTHLLELARQWCIDHKVSLTGWRPKHYRSSGRRPPVGQPPQGRTTHHG